MKKDELSTLDTQPGYPTIVLPEQEIINRQVDTLMQLDRSFERGAQRSRKMAKYRQFDEDFKFLCLAMEFSDRALPTRMRRRMLKILVRRFGSIAARLLLEMAKSKSDLGYRVIIRPRTWEERLDPKNAKKQEKRFKKEKEDARILLEVIGNRKKGMKGDESIVAALEELKLTWKGADGAKKALTRAIKASRKRGHIDPLAVVSAILGASRDSLSLSDLPKPGRSPRPNRTPG